MPLTKYINYTVFCNNMIITVIFAKPEWSSLKSQIIKADAFELVHIGEEDERLDRRERR